MAASTPDALEVEDEEGAHDVFAAHRADAALCLLPVVHTKRFHVVGERLVEPRLDQSRAVVQLSILIRESGRVEHVVDVLALLSHLAPETHDVEENRGGEANR